MKRLFLVILTVLTLIPLLSSLWASFQEPQIQGRLELYQTNLVLEATEYDRDSAATTSPEGIATLVEQLTGEDPYGNAIKQYESVLESSNTQLDVLNERAATAKAPATAKAIAETTTLIDELHVKLGILYAVNDQISKAKEQWQQIAADDQTYASLIAVLEPLWLEGKASESAVTILGDRLETWFQQQNLQQFFQVIGAEQDLALLQESIQYEAQQAFLKLTVVTILPFSVGIFGFGLLIFLVIQFVRKRQDSLLFADNTAAWETPWDGEIIWQVFIVGFFFVGQLLLPLVLPNLLQSLNLNAASWTVRGKAAYTLATYFMMAIAGILVLVASIWKFRPLPKNWFQIKWLDNWTVWGFGGYMVALPLVLIVSLINQQIWQGQGGSNPILFLALKAQDQVALTIFFMTASVLAPLYEEIMFRGFLLPSLTRYLPVWGSIVLSAFLFAIAHLSLSEVLPLMTLGIILGFVYTKSKNILAPMLLHSLWNSGTLLSLFILGS
ncbi:Abortive infection protein [[Leptolyngbya] sp. PCC 7376]|uniref:CPBP family intramembrane glutamic endopeptidase n=1 Tax=[Leptolyngbya] sp. PCC 7376 TaxID=111781 RepID=UPI00029F052C|nr:type II CAAX endopeptidase family protein [[Leptolyngbya] sp. PCC 7376]AFY37794.1 Abortive infection protein [[Leptolyngbya] sp. PCC 7376]